MLQLWRCVSGCRRPGAAAHRRGSPPPILGGLRLSIGITLGISVLGTTAIVIVFWLGGRMPAQPELENWLERGGRAVHSPPLLARLHSGSRKV